MKLIDAVAHVESGGNQFAMRFEPGLRAAMPAWLTAGLSRLDVWNGLTGESANAEHLQRALCTSFGRWQILGGNLYGPAIAYEGSLLKFLMTVEDQVAVAAKFIQSCGADPEMIVTSAGALLPFATRYNGPGQPQVYAAALFRAAQTAPGS